MQTANFSWKTRGQNLCAGYVVWAASARHRVPGAHPFPTSATWCSTCTSGAAVHSHGLPHSAYCCIWQQDKTEGVGRSRKVQEETTTSLKSGDSSPKKQVHRHRAGRAVNTQHIAHMHPADANLLPHMNVAYRNLPNASVTCSVLFRELVFLLANKLQPKALISFGQVYC